MVVRPRLELVVPQRKTATKARNDAKEKPSTTIRLHRDTHRALAIRAQLADMSMDEYLNLLMDHAPIDDATIRRALERPKRKVDK